MKPSRAILHNPVAIGVSALIFCANAPGASLITGINQLNGDTDRPTAKHTGETFNVLGGIQNYTVPTFGEDVVGMTDRTHQHNGASASLPLPDYLVGREYVLIANNNRDNPALQIDFSLSQRCLVYLLVDNRLGDGNAANPPDFTTLMTWVPRDGWEPVLNGLNRAGDSTQPDETGCDENADGSVNNWFSVYMRIVEAGENAFSTYDMGEGRNMYQIVVDAAAPPATPSGLTTALNGDNMVRLSWQLAEGAVGYNIKRAASPAGPFELIASDIRATSFDDTTALNGGTYYYVISASNPLGESGDSNQAIGRPNIPVVGVQAAGAAGSITLNWTLLDGGQSYRVKRSSASGGPYSEIASAVTGNSYVDASVGSGRIYYYVVSANLPGGESGASAETSALTGAGAPTISVETVSPSGLHIGVTTSDAIVDSFSLEQSSDGVSYTEVGLVTSPRNYWMVGGLAANSPQYFRARASNASGTSDYSAVASGTTAPEGGIYINFANPSFRDGQEGYPIPGFLDDYGDEFGDRGNGFSYGWDVPNGANARQRNSANSRDRRYDTFNHLQKPLPAGRVWEIEVTGGKYQVRIVGGDPDNLDSVFQYLVEGVPSDSLTPTGATRFIDTTVVAEVTDGRLTIENGPAAANNKIAFIELTPFVETELKITGISLANGKVTITWTGGGTLLVSDELTGGAWTAAGTGGTVTLDATANHRYFRASR